jgi:hypothetical protein
MLTHGGSDVSGFHVGQLGYIPALTDGVITPGVSLGTFSR